MLHKRLSTFFRKDKTMGSVPENAILVTADVVGFDGNSPHEEDLKTLKKALEREILKECCENGRICIE